jgi:RsiW-degrading membrane proteinase PrsW (M82 family)
MATHLLVSGLVALLPVLCFLGALLYLDGYKLVTLRTIFALVACGAVAAGASFVVNAVAFEALGLDLPRFMRYVSPLTEELLKGLVVVALILLHRIGFLVDAAICGFAVGTGFAVVENLYYLDRARDAGLGTWLVRGFGTAIMHGGATAMLGVMSLAVAERTGGAGVRTFLPGFGVAALLHSAFNHVHHSPQNAMLAVIVILPPLFYGVFRQSEKSVGDWLGKGFDADTEMLELINSGSFGDSPVGRYLHTLKDKFAGPVVADVLCYLRLYTELALRAKGILMMRESGFDAPVDEETKAKFEEMRYLEGSIGKTGLLAIHPMLHMSRKDLWQLYMLGK